MNYPAGTHQDPPCPALCLQPGAVRIAPREGHMDDMIQTDLFVVSSHLRIRGQVSVSNQEIVFSHHG